MENGVFWKPGVTLVGEDGLRQLHQAATAILERVGLNVHHPGMRQRLAAAGARLGTENRVYVPADLVEQSLRTAKRNIVIYNRLGEPAMPLDPFRIFFGTGSDLINTWDVATVERRASVLVDAGRAARVCDALDELDFVMSFALPSEVRNEDAEPQQFYVLLQNTTKPVIMTSFSGLAAFERLHEMACVVAGGEQAFRQHPNYIMYGQFVSPLQHDLQAVERLVFCAEHEIPLIYIPTIIPGASGPITLVGSLAVAAAETLAGLVMHQVCRPGAPFIFGACVSQLDMRTMLYPYGSPEWRLNDVVMAALARHYGLPVFGTGGATDSKVVDAQAGMEYANSLLIAALAGTNLIHDVGYLESGRTGSLESIVLGAEQIRWIKRFLAGVEVSDETFGLDVIANVGPGGQFLDQPHTLKHLRRNMWLPYIGDHGTFESWAAGGCQDYAARARTRAQALIATHRPAPLGESMEAALKELCESDL